MCAERLDPAMLMTESLRGGAFKTVELVVEGVWQFCFTAGDLLVECPWKAVEAGSVVLASGDHQQKYGLPEPIDAPSRIRELLKDRIVVGIKIDNVTSDLSVIFTRDFRFEVFNDSSGYEGWTYSDHHGLKLVQIGDGKMAIWKGNS
jgi:hypothetical protein